VVGNRTPVVRVGKQAGKRKEFISSMSISSIYAALLFFLSCSYEFELLPCSVDEEKIEARSYSFPAYASAEADSSLLYHREGAFERSFFCLCAVDL
jgi:hypothetical protein